MGTDKILFTSTRYTDDNTAIIKATWQLGGVKGRRVGFRDLEQVSKAVWDSKEVYAYFGYLWAERLKELGVAMVEPPPDLLLAFSEDIVKRKIWTTTADQVDPEEELFFKPFDGGKQFDGAVMLGKELRDLVERIGDLKIMCSTVVNFVEEYRFFIMEQEIMTGTHYKGQASTKGYEKCIDFAKFILPSIWTTRYVLDVGVLVGGDVAVIEANPIHQSAIYNANPLRILLCLRVY